jgi:DivIVA domain-containing protein
MDRDDPEKRIGDLERQLAEPRAFPQSPTSRSASTAGHLTPDEVRNMVFAKPPIGRRGYNESEVDAFLDLVEAALRNPVARILTPDQVRNVVFAKPPIGRRGYNESEVDAFLDRVEAALVEPRPEPPKGEDGQPPRYW